MEKKKAPGVVSEINVTPMVDVMLVLLIIFMVITPMLSKGQTVNMVKTYNDKKIPDADKEDAILIADHARRPGLPEPWKRPDSPRRSCRQGQRPAGQSFRQDRLYKGRRSCAIRERDRCDRQFAHRRCRFSWIDYGNDTR